MHSRSFFRNPSPILVGPCGLLLGEGEGGREDAKKRGGAADRGGGGGRQVRVGPDQAPARLTARIAFVA